MMELLEPVGLSSKLSPHMESRKGSSVRKRQQGTAMCCSGETTELPPQPRAEEHREELSIEEQSFRDRCTTEETYGINELFQQDQSCSDASSLLSTHASSVSTHIRRVSQDEDNSAAGDILIDFPGDIHNDFPSSSERGRHSPGVKRRRESFGFISDDLEPVDSSGGHKQTDVADLSTLSKKRRRMPLRNRALVAEDFDQILTQIF